MKAIAVFKSIIHRNTYTGEVVTLSMNSRNGDLSKVVSIEFEQAYEIDFESVDDLIHILADIAFSIRHNNDKVFCHIVGGRDAWNDFFINVSDLYSDRFSMYYDKELDLFEFRHAGYTFFIMQPEHIA